MLRITELRLPLNHPEPALRAAVLARLGLTDAALRQMTIARRGYDARRKSDIVLVSNAGKAVWFDEEDVRPMGRGARGVRGMKLQEGQSVISLLVAESDQQTVLVATENGYGKRTVLADFRHSGRGTQGVRAIADSERNGTVVGAKLVNDEDEIILKRQSVSRQVKGSINFNKGPKYARKSIDNSKVSPVPRRLQDPGEILEKNPASM